MTANKKPSKTSLFTTKVPYMHVLGTKVHLGDIEAIKSTIFAWFCHNKQYQISTPNPEQVVLAQKNKEFQQVLNQSDLNVPDGIGLVWAVNRQTKSAKIMRITGIDLMLELCAEAEQQGWRVFLLGGRPGAAKQAATELKKSYPKLKIGWHAGAKNIRKETADEKKEAIKQINQFLPHLLFVAYGAPHQELWIAQNLPNLKVRVGMSVGGAFDYISGAVKRPPVWARRAGLEWFFRLLTQPWRIKRQLRLVKFVYLIITAKK